MSADGHPMDVDAMTKGKGKGRKGKAREMKTQERVQNMRTQTQSTTSRTENVCTVRTKETLQRTARIDSTMRKPKQGNIVTTQRAKVQMCNNAWQHWKRVHRKLNVRAHHFSSLQHNLQQCTHRWQDTLRRQHQRHTVAILQDKLPDADSDFGFCMTAEVNEQTTVDVDLVRHRLGCDCVPPRVPAGTWHEERHWWTAMRGCDRERTA